MRDSGILALRLTVGGYLAVHGAQKLFGHFDGPGLDNAGAFFDHMGLKPGKPFAALAAGSELAGGLLTATGLGSPVGPFTIAAAMAVAVTFHLDNGPMGQKGGYELPLTDMMAGLALALTGPGRYSLDQVLPRSLPRRLVQLTVLGGTALSAYSASKVLAHKKSQEPDPPVEEQAEDGTDSAAR
jgi:putative oxidoreductase